MIFTLHLEYFSSQSNIFFKKKDCLWLNNQNKALYLQAKIKELVHRK